MNIPEAVVPLIRDWPLDWLILIFFAVALSLEGFRSGSTRASAIAAAFPLSFLVTQWLPNTFFIGTIVQQLTDPMAFAGVFAVVFIGMYILLNRILFSFASASGNVATAFICGFSATLIIVMIWIQAPGLRELWRFGPQVQLVFGEAYRAWWFILAYAAIAFARG